MNKPFLFSLLLIYATHTQAALETLDKIIVVINDDVITQQELSARTDEFKNKLRLKNLTDENLNALTKQVLEKMIRTRIQLQHAEKLGIKVDDVALNRILEKIAESNKLTLDELRQAIKAEGLNFSRFRDQTRTDLIIKQLQERMVASKINVTDQEIEQFIKTSHANDQADTRYLLRHILISTPETATPEDIQKASEKANRLYGMIKRGDDFADIALRYSNGRNALKGGDLGWKKANELPVIFVSVIKKLKDGDVSEPVRSASGFHILKLTKSSRKKEMIEQTHARHILIRTGANMTNEQAKNTLLDLKKKIEAGGDFTALAREHSQDPGSKEKGGDLGWAGPGTYVSTFEEAMASLKTGEISEPFNSQFGWHILQVIERRSQDKSSDVQKSQARQIIHKRKTEEELQLWLRRIHDESYIEYKVSDLEP